MPLGFGDAPDRRKRARPPQDAGVRDLSYRLAVAVSDFHFSFELGGRKEALIAIHRIMLELGGQMGGKTYHQHLADGDVSPDAWHPGALPLAQTLRFSPERFATVEAWHDEASRLLAPLLPTGGQSIKQRLRRNVDLDKALSVHPHLATPRGRSIA